MADGIRIRPQPNRVVPLDAMIVLRDIARPLPAPRDGRRLEDVQPKCSHCGVQHFHKTYHLQLRAGTVIVSTTIWDELLKMPDHGGFEYVNHVSDPPTQHIQPGQETRLIEKFVAPITLN